MKKFIIVCILIAFIMSGCQATPEDLIVQQKDTDELLEKIYAEDEPESADSDPVETEADEERTDEYRAIDHASFDMELVNGIKLSVDNDLLVPDKETFPIVTYKRKVFTDEDINCITELFLKGNNLYHFRDDRVMTKSELEEMIIMLKRDYSSLDSEVAKMKGITDINELYKLRDDALAECYEELETAPEEIKAEVHNMNYANHSIMGDAKVDGRMYVLYINDAEDSSRSNIEDMRPRISFSRFNYHADGYKCLYKSLLTNRIIIPGIGILPRVERNDWGSSYVISTALCEDQPDEIDMTIEEAKETALDTFKQVGAGDDIDISGIFLIGYSDSSYDITCYAVELKRQIDGMPITQRSLVTTDGMERRSDDTNRRFASSVPSERMIILLNDEGILDFEWSEPVERIEEINNNAELITSQAVIENFKQAFINGYSFETFGDSEYLKNMALNEISLGYGMARIPNDKELFMAIPLWNFYKTCETRGHTYTSSLITINALDGSRFNPGWGY